MGWFGRTQPARGAQPQPGEAGSTHAELTGEPAAGPRPLTEAERRELASRWMREQLLRRRASFTDARPVRARVATWNVNGKRPHDALSPAELRAWLHEDGAAEADLVVVGFQEVVPLTAANVALNSDAAAGVGALWDELLDAALNNASSAASPPVGAAEGEDGARRYTQVASVTMVGIHLAVWVRASLAVHVRGLDTAVVGTGVGGFMGNKGAVVARFRLFDTSFAFVCAHLSSGQSPTAHTKRAADVAEILKRCPNISKHDVQCWLGDLNYRLQAGIAEIVPLIKAGDWGALRALDELSREREAGHVFAGWKEAELTFPPTYKYRLGTEEYGLGLQGQCSTANAAGGGGRALDDQAPGADWGARLQKEVDLSKEKVRRPAWCDRVLARVGAQPGTLEQVDIIAYDAVGRLSYSDHKPVTAVLAVEGRVVDPARLDRTKAELRREMDALEMDMMPKCTLTDAIVDLGVVLRGTPRTATVTLANVGAAMAAWSILRREDDEVAPEMPDWLTITPTSGTLMPGEVVHLKIEALVSAAYTGAEQEGEKVLDTIQILRIGPRGRDFFIPVSGRCPPPTATAEEEEDDEVAGVDAVPAPDEAITEAPPVDGDILALSSLAVADEDAADVGHDATTDGSPRPESDERAETQN